MNDPVKLPVVGALKLTLRWCMFIMRRHLTLVLVYSAILWGMQALAAVSLPFFINFNIQVNKALVRLFIGSDAIYACIAVFLLLIIHNEVLRGPAGFNRETMGRWNSRAFGYIFDCVLIGVFATAFSAIAGVAAFSLLNWVVGSNSAVATFLGFFCSAGVVFVAVAFVARLSLRLPSRSIGQVLPWPDVWRMGRGNTGRLIVGMLVPVLSIMLVVIAIVVPVEALSPPAPASPGLIQTVAFRPNEVLRIEPAALRMPLPPSWSKPDVAFGSAMLVSLIWAIGVTLQAVVLCIFVSLSYGYLQDNLPSEMDDLGY